MVCSHCQTDHGEALPDACPTCGAPLHEDDQATRVGIESSSDHPHTELRTGSGSKRISNGQNSHSAESDIATGAGASKNGPASGVHSAEQVGPLGFSVHGWTSAMEPSFATGALCLMPGVVLGSRYQILISLGEGGMGTVYKARDLEVNRLVAIKIIRPELAKDPIIVERFKQELLLASQVTHRNVVRIYDLGVASGLRFISMEYIDGHELSDVIREQGKFKPAEAAQIILQVCRGLEAAHAQGVIHRDLKPQNIMLDAQGRATVMDFGIAYAAATVAPDESSQKLAPVGPEGLTQVGSLLGTPRYMSPEQAHGRRVDVRSDIYTLGVIFYELLTGKGPFSAPTVKELVGQRGKETIVPPSSVDRSIPKRASDIVMKCLEGSPDRRYQSTAELIEDLEIWLGLRTKSRVRWTILAASIALIAVTVSSLLVRERLASKAARAHPPVTILITDFRNTTGQQVLSSAVEPMLQVAVEGAPFVSAFNRGQARKIAAAIQPGASKIDERLGRLVAIREGIGVVIGGAVERHDDRLRLAATVTDANGKILLSDSSDFKRPDDLPKAVDKIAARIRRVLGDSSNSAKASSAETFTSGSLESAQLYETAQQLQWEGKWTQAIATWKRATSLDPKMSRAYAGIAATYANLGERRQAIHYYELALANINRESDREKYRTRGGYYLLMRDYRKAAEQFSQLVKQYPFDSAGLANLALANFYARDMTAALEQGRKAVEIYPQNILQRNNLGLYAMYAGDFDTAIKESETIIKMNPSFEKAYLCLGMAQLQNGSPQTAAATYDKLAKLSDWGASEAALAQGDLALYQGRFSDAIKVLHDGIAFDASHRKSGPQAIKLVALAQAQLQKQQRGPALKSAAGAVSASNDESVLYGAADIDLKAGELRAADSLATKLDESFEPEPRALGKLIDGEVQMQSGKLHEAVESFTASQKLADTWLGRYDLGRAYLAAKLYPDAENEFEVCLKRRGEASAVFLDDEPTIRYVPSTYYYLGIAKAGLHSSDAREEFAILLKMKGLSEPDPMVADATHRLRAP